MNNKACPDYAVLLLAFGCADCLEHIEPFLKNLVQNRLPTPELVNTIKRRYRLIGGKSPLLDITRKQALALEKSLSKGSEYTFKLYVGMRYWHPYIKDTLKEIENAGIKKIIAISMSPQKSNFTVGGYKKLLENTLNHAIKKPHIKIISEFHSNETFLRSIADKIQERLSLDKYKNNKPVIIFTAHSMPINFLSNDDPYVEQLEQTIQGILKIIGKIEWKFGYQSKSNIPGPWLEPSIDNILENLNKDVVENVLMVPIGFVSDHVETLYDIDIVYKQKTESLGMRFDRTSSLNCSSLFIKALDEIVRESLEI